MSSRIQELESSLSALENDLKRVQNKEAEAKLAAENATEEINQFKEEVKGIFGATCICLMAKIENLVTLLSFFGFASPSLFMVEGYYWGEGHGYMGSALLFYLPFEIEFDGNKVRSILTEADRPSLQIVYLFFCLRVSLFSCSLSTTLVEWKSKSEDCEKEIQEWKKRASSATTSISKLNRLINSKVV